ncbi:hypothetical protein PtA15_7A413 [Puccinia triticina]|uniref:Uncharacterized protein n=1 Tax=Puccinia triticina TaxID=208348 RepID=A0ABY7CPT5_9BASI|nr:uncharacterized protein PtA15_7A413 [Puccinia triticina]WAQ86685.1 hypothetical protein PtA15_7A413 [Puccinia triticina]
MLQTAHPPATNQLPPGYYPPTNLGGLNQLIPSLATDSAASLPNPQAPLPALATPAAPPATVPAALGAGPKEAARHSKDLKDDDDELLLHSPHNKCAPPHQPVDLTNPPEHY